MRISDWSSDVCSSDLADPCLLPEVDPLDFLEDAVDEMLAGLLAVGDDVDPGLGLVEQGEAHGVALGLLEPRGIPGGPRRPELFRLRKPCRLGQAAGDRRLHHRKAPPTVVILRFRYRKSVWEGK